MNKLKALEEKFFLDYPQGFDSEEMLKTEKKHKLDKMSKMARENFSVEAFESGDILESFKKLINQSSLVSRFEKPTFKHFIETINEEEKVLLIKGIYENLHGDEKLGFEIMCDLMRPYKTAKWPILTVLRAYYNLQTDIFIKPTTVKSILNYFESDLKYTSKPNFEFYDAYRSFLNGIKDQASQAVKPNNPAFSGFMRLTIDA